MSNPEPILLSRKDAAASLGISIRQLDKLVRRRQITHVRIGMRRLFTKQALADFVQRQSVRDFYSEQDVHAEALAN